MPVPDTVLKLCETFADHREHFRSGNYNEFQLRKQFLDPLFEALGWDMANSQGLAPQYRDVIHEDAIKIGPHVKAPDYAFTLHGQRKFFLEAKKPSVNIKGDVAPAYQLRRYAWSAKLPLSILSDFEEFAIYDTRIKPAPGDPSSTARVFYCTCDQFAEKWDEIAAIFSRDAILKGSFDKYADSTKKKKGTAEVDTAFLEEIERWRDLLARNFALRNPTLTVRDLNFAVQKTIDRLVFLRICEDRGTEDYGRLRTVANGTQTYPRLLELFRAADARYNSGLFHFSKEKDQAEEPDTLTPNLALDDKTLKDIIAHLYYPDSPYEFSVLPADILGSVYERFLGKTIRLTDGHQAKIEEKPEVRKAGGVYYTPSYIVDYIVQNTLGKLLTPETEKPIPLADAAKLKVVDPACGSGSFLIVAYQFLLDWHRDRYAENPEKWSKGKTGTLYQAKGGEWRLTTAEKKRILLNNIHGVDIDAAAVEVTKLSLLLKVLEGETGEIAQRDFLKERERILPDLANNIKCGNSLIGPDFYDAPEMDLLDDEARYRVNVFDWKAAFPEVFSHGGFDCVIGNPPYVRVQLFAHHETDYLFRAYKSASSKIDLSVFFLEKSFNLITESGLIGLITTKQWMSTDYGTGIRSILADGLLKHVMDFGSLPVFANADTYPAILVCQRKKTKEFDYGLVLNREGLNIQNLISLETTPIPFSQLGAQSWNLSGFDLVEITKKREIQVLALSKFGHVYIGDLTGMDEAFVLKREECDNQSLASGLLYPYAYRGAEISRYSETEPQSVVIYPYTESESGNLVLIDEEELRKRAPNIFDRLSVHKNKLRQRMDSRRLYAAQEWYRHLRPGSFSYIRPEKLIFKGIDTRLSVGLLGKDSIFNGANTPAFIPEALGKTSLLFLLGVLNSRLIGFYLVRVCPPKLGGYTRFNASNINAAPIRLIDFTKPADVEKHDRMVSLVDRMLVLVPKRRAEANPQAAAQLDAQIAATDRQIDRLVYDLYGLTEEEIALVEGA
jgi:hypothetical protein